MTNNQKQLDSYDVIVVGGGHAGAEAAWAAANLTREQGGRVALITIDPGTIGVMSCNPAIGGLAKGQMVREIDALGGLMGLAIDRTGIQFRILNLSKGPAVRGPRAQADKYLYAAEVQRLLGTRENLDIIAGTIDDIHFDAVTKRIEGVTYSSGGKNVTLRTKSLILTTGTFMRGLMHTGESQTKGGRVGEAAAYPISGALQKLGLELGRLKTGTPPRIDVKTIDFSSLERQPGDENPVPFSDLTERSGFPKQKQVDCWITHTCEKSHELIRANLDRAPMYNGQIETAGPRYCPSIEDKVVRFADRHSHHVFLEPESLSTDEIYCNGISTSLPADIQQQVVNAMPGCERAVILRHGYAIEYDMVWPHQIDATTMVKTAPGLFLAGQINGTSGYEEAGAQGMLAGMNAVRFNGGDDLVRFTRDQAYLGVLMDDLVTKIPREPYRMFTSRAEYRLLLRADNTDFRLTPLGRELGLVDDTRYEHFERKRKAREALEAYMTNTRLDGDTLMRSASRPQLSCGEFLAKLGGMEHGLGDASLNEDLVTTVLADLQYAGYIGRHKRQIDKLAAQEAMPIPMDLDYTDITGLRNEAAQTLNKFAPATLGQAARLAGVTPADLMVVSVALARV
ncbi:tRNA uridine 5-carboxymethylaminomethyl modification enzyme MnmG [Poriferisphaera corsica]|uniref:tRNA uridine 5-carboxymethylaminomethyl modification enzyme MnmG n=1 Tax=Poriferisphaera corsica TaxID=2528020 RepID=A0A517YVD6_9BACT|nr:tRNA uridine-5-carboxymethylaminomethyl(34) synthesis enzyme MnmG [Poriferisphaera corsica]QDU34156.1 tRNA uridine 5-carboxymethylaminomethyl modification enzyme MnmG [Poriferisphaera corsica]